MTPHRPHTLLLATLALWTMAFVAWTADALVEPVPFAMERALRRLCRCACSACCFALRWAGGWCAPAAAAPGASVWAPPLA
ncbi:MAG: hypothetical protein ABT19_06120 [Rhodanobacter sp. SCN 68-63]|nr:MAG: hypothetical protein ABT19_06120 [Rhodanobacter sp. SCN 68-63]